MSYKFKIVKIADNRQWQPNPDKPTSGASPDGEGSWLARKVICEIYNTDSEGNNLSLLETKEFLVEAPYSLEKLEKLINEYEETLPERNEDEGLEL